MFRKLLFIPCLIVSMLVITVPPVSATTLKMKNYEGELSEHSSESDFVQDNKTYEEVPFSTVTKTIKSIVPDRTSLSLLPNLQLATQWKPIEVITDPLKPWRITFSQPMSLSEENWYNGKILDEVGTEVSLKIGMNANRLLLTPTVPYEEGKTYTLLLNKELYNERGISLGKDVYQQFVYQSPKPAIHIPDYALEKAVRTALNKPNGIITASDMLSLETLFGVDKGIKDLTGLEYAKNLKELFLQHNQISNISPLRNLVNLQKLSLENNLLSDINYLYNMNKLELLWLNLNQISNIGVLKNLSSLQGLALQNNQIEDITPLTDLANFNWLNLQNNKIVTINSLLLMNTTKLEVLWLTENPLEYLSNQVVNTLRKKGVNVSHNTVISSSNPPYEGTVYVDSNIITANDPSSFKKLSYAGRAMRTMYDRRSASWIQTNPYLFRAEYYDGNPIEIQVNPEFQSNAEAESQAIRFARPIGQLPNFLRERVSTVWIHKGKELFGGGNNNILIHTEQADQYTELGVLEEVLFHEATHTSIDPVYSHHSGWNAAQQADGNSISSYAKEFPDREDLAESLLMYYAFRQNPERISKEMKHTISKTMPNRIIFFDQQL
ncbi:hypothetical protein CSV77_05755 [Sporosarcina sp. P16b]|uniref:leucine-rich repeat domain-containing protein n=1 Tax=Sporosarcina sp. P16b TaxID=2048261 RepID=UPI000C17120E|nr:leucine-rich repeat domain-containing protein [Sporosarcina sp. P16b]PIC70815.1 hypothetical protein CSV77_05755 [Sporosarcina sp. P16b]